MKLVQRWMGLEIVFVQVGHGLLGAAVVGLIASQAPWWFTLAIAPLVAFSLAFWLMESSFVLPVARRLLAGRGVVFPLIPSIPQDEREDGWSECARERKRAEAPDGGDATATTRPRG